MNSNEETGGFRLIGDIAKTVVDAVKAKREPVPKIALKYQSKESEVVT